MRGRPPKYRDAVFAQFEMGNWDIADIVKQIGVSETQACRLREQFRRRRNLISRMSPREAQINPEPFTMAIVRGCFLHNWPTHKAASMSGLSVGRVSEIYRSLEETKFRDLYTDTQEGKPCPSN